jgi:phage gpG-like protein
MKTHLLKTQALSGAAFQWLQNKYLAVDGRNRVDFGKHLAENCTLQFGNNPLAVGKEELLNGIGQFWKSINGLNHNFVNVVGTDNHLVLEALIDYTRTDNKVVQIPCVTMIERNDEGLATSIRIFLDVAPVYA